LHEKSIDCAQARNRALAFLTRCAKELRTAIRVEQYRRARDAYLVSGAAQPMQLRLLSQSTA
jgi:hypothetical protein